MSYVKVGRVLVPTKSNAFKHRVFLQNLHRIAREVSEGKRPAVDLSELLKDASPSELRALCEVTQNLLKKRFPKTGNGFIKKLRPFKALIRRLACPKISLAAKKKTLVRSNIQTGGLPFLVPLLAPVIGTLISAGIEAAI